MGEVVAAQQAHMDSLKELEQSLKVVPADG